ncbi:MAG: hypothetical protein KAT79_03355 [candidate division Zixibacteria bacterium]|nr:hypothetical protein [candidate division Zixibacteria bacterium]
MTAENLTRQRDQVKGITMKLVHTANQKEDFQGHLERYLSMALHYEEIQLLAKIAKKVHDEHSRQSHDTDGDTK